MKKYDVQAFIDFHSKSRNRDKQNRLIVRKNYIECDEKKYPYSKFSSWNIQKYDKKILKNINARNNSFLLRTLKYVGSLDVINPRLVVANSIVDNFTFFILYQEHDKEKIIDYGRNLVMDKDDYYELFEINEFNRINKRELLIINTLLKMYKEYNKILEYLFFTKEKFKDCYSDFPELFEKYNRVGINYGHTWLSYEFDCLFFRKMDNKNTKYYRTRFDIPSFSLDPCNKNRFIKEIHELNGGKKYLYKRENEQFSFRLLSDIIFDEEEKKILLSLDRYHKCHIASHKIGLWLTECGINEVYITSGKNTSNDKDYYYHSWVEYEVNDKTFVVDYTNNLIIDKDIYYRLYESVVINRTMVDRMKMITDYIVDNSFDFVLSPFILNYFGEELLTDIKKNEKVLLKK